MKLQWCSACLLACRRVKLLLSCLQIEYREPLSGVGRMPGGRSKTEGGPNDREAETAMLIEKAIMPLFPPGFNHNLTVGGHVSPCHSVYLCCLSYLHCPGKGVQAHCLLSIQPPCQHCAYTACVLHLLCAYSTIASCEGTRLAGTTSETMRSLPVKATPVEGIAFCRAPCKPASHENHAHLSNPKRVSGTVA